MKSIFICLLFLLPLQIMAQTYSADLCNDGIASESSKWADSPTYAASKAFDNVIHVGANTWASKNLPTSLNPEWIMYDFGVGNEKKITKYTVRARAPYDRGTTDISRSPKDWFFEASNDNLNWTILDTQTNQTNWKPGNGTLSNPPEMRAFTITNNQAYRYYRIKVTANNGGDRWVSIGEIEMMSNIEDTYTDYENKRGNIWYFGNNAGISFNTEPPIALTDGQLVAREGCATICDIDGSLLFYTNGMTVWNKAHSIMENGDSLMLYNPANPLHPTQSGVITPSPQDSVYYVFSSPCQWVSPATDRYFRYAIVDMRLNGGLGKVVQKDIQIGTEKGSERITAVAHANNEDIWVINHLDDSNTFQAFLITASGIDIANPVVSNIGAASSGNCNTGYLKASPDGKKLAMAFWCDNTPSHFELYDFDAATGVISNLNNLGYPSGLSRQSAYGIEFSPDGTKLYGSTNMAKTIHQWDLKAGSNTQIKNSCTQIGTTSNYVGALQLAPNGKIYCALSIDGNTPFERVGVIHYPNMKGTVAKYDDYALHLAGKGSRQGFPNFIQTFMYKPATKASSLCFGDSTQFSLSSTYMLSSVSWNFDDPASGVNNTSNLFAPKHKFSSPGTYNVRLIRNYTNSAIDTVFHVVNIYPIPVINLGNDTIICSNSSIILNPGAGFTSYLWTGGSTNQTLTINTTGKYGVTVHSGSCSATDSINITVIPMPVVDLGPDTTICEGETITLDAGAGADSYLWGTSETSQTFDVNMSGTYSVVVTNGGLCSASDQITITVNPVADATITNPGPLCYNDAAVNLTAATAGGIWSGNGITDVNAGTFNSATAGVGTHTITYGISGTCGDTATVQITVINQADATITPVTDMCDNYPSINLTVADAGGTWSGVGVSPTGTFNPSIAGVGAHIITYGISGNCGDTANIVITVNQSPTASIYALGETCQDKNDGIAWVVINGGTPPYNILWSNNETTDAISPLAPGMYNVTISDAKNCGSTLNVDVDMSGDLCDNPVVWVPNVFSPNDDGQNDILFVHGKGVSKLLFAIYDRWGEKVFESTSMDDGWDGKFKGAKLKPGVFFYYVEATFEDNTVSVFEGNVTLVR